MTDQIDEGKNSERFSELNIPLDDEGLPKGTTLTIKQQEEANINLQLADNQIEEKRLVATITCIAAAARLQGLEMRRYPVAGENPLTPEEHLEYMALMQWWTQWADEKKIRLAFDMRKLSENVEQFARIY